MKTTYSVTMTEEVHQKLFNHLVRPDEQEDLCFATYVPSNGSDRFSGIIDRIVLPNDGERNVHGNVGFLADYFERVLRIANQRNAGIAFLHSHPWPGWQPMSPDDKIAESRMAPAVMSVTSYPLLGLTLGTDGTWSARFWKKNESEKRRYDRHWCEIVRVVGTQLSISFNDKLMPAHINTKRQLRTISAWGSKTQQDLSRLRIGIVGLGSVGSLVAEILARIGISFFTLIDFDSVEEKNLDRLINVFRGDIGRPKVAAIRDAIMRSASSPEVEIDAVEYSVCEETGFRKALNCDLLFSCVDRPWPRQVLNFIAFAHLVPVIDGGIRVRTNEMNSRMIGADWKSQTVGIRRACLECLGQYKSEFAILERNRSLDDPTYIAGLPRNASIDFHENVFAFSSHLASMEVIQMLSLFVSPSGISDVGQQIFHLTLGTMDVERHSCHPSCYFRTIIGKGDLTGVQVHGDHERARLARQKRIELL